MQIKVVLKDLTCYLNMFDRLRSVFDPIVGLGQLVMSFAVSRIKFYGLCKNSNGLFRTIQLKVDFPQIILIQMVLGILFNPFNIFFICSSIRAFLRTNR